MQGKVVAHSSYAAWYQILNIDFCSTASSKLKIIKQGLQVKLIKKLERIKIKKELKPANVRVTVVLTLNNVFVTVQNGGMRILKTFSLGSLKFQNSRKRLFTSTWLLAKEVSQYLIKLPNFYENKKLLICKNTNLKNYRFKGFLKGLYDYNIIFDKMRIKQTVAYNGCKKRSLERTGRKRIVFFS